MPVAAVRRSAARCHRRWVGEQTSRAGGRRDRSRGREKKKKKTESWARGGKKPWGDKRRKRRIEGTWPGVRAAVEWVFLENKRGNFWAGGIRARRDGTWVGGGGGETK